MAWRDWFRRRDRHVETRDEIEAHLRMAIQDRIAAGESPDEASRNAHREFGSVRAALDDARSVWGWTRAEQLLFDARSGARILITAPALSLTVILLVALVIGGNTTIYSAVHAMLTKPAPGVNPDGLAAVSWLVDGRMRTPVVRLPHVKALEQSRLARVGAFRGDQIALGTAEGTFAVRGASVTSGYFETLGAGFVRGRGFPSAGQPQAGLTAVISERLWQRQFAAREDAIGTAIHINGRPATIAGIVAGPFQGMWLAEGIDLWVPFEAFARPRAEGTAQWSDSDIHGVVVRRLGTSSMSDVEAELRILAAAVPPSGDSRVRYEPSLVDYTGVAARQNMIANYGPRFLSIFSIVTLLTVCIVCANVANLMLARSVSRQREMAVRQSFGASRWRITRLVMAESLTLALAGWAVACMFAYWVARMLPSLIPASESGGADVLLDFTPDWNVLAYAMLLALTAAVTFTLAPAIRTWRLDLLSFLKAGERGVVQGRSRATRALVVVQLSLSVVLLTSAGLAYRSLSLMTGRDLGFDTGNLLLLTLDTSSADARTPEARFALRQGLLDAIRDVPLVQSAAYATQAPSQNWSRRRVRGVEGGPPVITERNNADAAFLDTLALQLIRGTTFSASAQTGARTEAIVNLHLAEALWPGTEPLGRTLHFDSGRTATVVGVMPNALIGGHRRESRPLMAVLSTGETLQGAGFLTFYVRYRGGLDAAVPSVTRAMRAAAPSVPVTYVQTMDAALHDMTWLNRALTMMLLMFAGGSLLIAALGQYAAMAFAMRQRIRDFAIRMAMGASSRQILTSAVREGLMLTAAGLALGGVLGAIAGWGGRALLHGVTPTDAMTYAGVLLVLGVASLAACYVPALRASRVDPIEALRAE